MCNQNDIENEFHFILKCPLYNELWKKIIKRFYYVKPNVYKLVDLLSVAYTKELNHFTMFYITGYYRSTVGQEFSYGPIGYVQSPYYFHSFLECGVSIPGTDTVVYA